MNVSLAISLPETLDCKPLPFLVDLLYVPAHGGACGLQIFIAHFSSANTASRILGMKGTRLPSAGLSVSRWQR